MPATQPAPVAPSGAELAPGLTIDRPLDGSSTFLQHLTVAGRAPDQCRVVLEVDGKAVGDGVSGGREPGRYEFVGVPMGFGPRRIKIRAIAAGGRVMEVSASVKVLGPPAKVRIEGPARVPADARTEAEYRILLQDAFGNPAVDGYFVTVSAEGATLDSQDADPNTAGVQLRPVDGAATLKLKSPNVAQPAVLRASVAHLAVSYPIAYTTPRRPFLLVGQFSSMLGSFARGSAGAPEGSRAGLFNDTGFGFFARGTVADGYLLTAAFSSRQKLQDRLFKELDPERMYPVLGDSSSVFYEAQARSQAYVQLEKDQNTYRYGDFSTDFGLGLLGSYQRSLTGVRLQHSGSFGRVLLFGARTSQSEERVEIRGNGTSGYYFIPRAPLVMGSEKVTLEVRDRDRPQVVLHSEPRVRYSEYDIDYVQGSLFFKEPVPGIDADQNPVYIVVVYESEASGTDHMLGGARADIRAGSFSFGSTLVREERGDGPYGLRSFDASVRLPGKTVLSTEYAVSDSALAGDAWPAQLHTAPSDALQVNAYMRSTSATFDNPSTPTYQLGSRGRGVDARLNLPGGQALTLLYYWQSGGGTAFTSANARYERTVGRGKADVELISQFTEGSGAAPSDHSVLVSSKLLLPVIARLNLLLQREQVLSGVSAFRPAGTTLGFDALLSPKIKLEAREKITDSGKSLASFGLALSPRFLKGTSFTSKYEIHSVNNGGYNQASVGLNTAIPVAKFVTGNLAYERVMSIGGGSSYNSGSAGLEYKPNFPFVGSLKLEQRTSGTAKQSSATLGATGRLGPSLALMLRMTQYNDGGAAPLQVGPAGTPRVNTSVGLAFRPVHDRLNILARYQMRQVMPGQFIGNTLAQGTSDLFSVEGIYQRRRGQELTLKYAFRTASTFFDGTGGRSLTDLWLGRFSHDLSDHWTFSTEARVLRQRETGTDGLGYGAELGFLPRHDMVLGLGYNFAGQHDPDLSEGRRWAKGPYLRFGWKFDEDLLGLGERKGAEGKARRQP